MDQKMLDNFTPMKSLFLGVAAGAVVLCVIGFIVMSVLYFAKKDDPTGVTTAPASQTRTTGAAAAVTPAEVPRVELFVMSYCPYGLQMQKAILPVMNLLAGKADIQIKFVDYIMHGAKEATENSRQYCIQKYQPEKYQNFLNCFTAATPGADGTVDAGQIDSCMASTGVDKETTERCITDTTREFQVAGTAYPVNAAENEKYGVSGSPTMVVNGARVSPASRSPEAVKELICAAFVNPPAECATDLSATPAAAGFGTAAGTGSDASCG